MALTPSMKILKYISKHPHVTTAELLVRYKIDNISLSDCLTPAYLADYIQIVRDEHDPLTTQFLLTETGKSYLDDYRTKSRDFWIPTAIALIALLKSFENEVSSALHILMQLLKG